VEVGSQKIAWHEEVTDNSHITPNDKYEFFRKVSMDIPDDSYPDWPKSSAKSRQNIKSPHELDEELNNIREELNKCIQINHAWFVKSPMDVLMEKLFKEKLKEEVLS
jgi:hypothetical protein